MKKVFHLYKTFYPYTHGGIETYIDSIIQSQSKFEHYFLSIGNSSLSNSQKFIFKKTFRYSSDIFSLDLCKYIIKNIDKDHDIIHLHTPWPTMEFFLCFLNFKKIIATYHSDIIRQKFVNFFFKYITIYFLKRKVGKVIATSDIYYKSSKILQKISKKKICIIPIGIKDLTHLDNLKKDLRENYILFIGSNRSYKGIPLLEQLLKKESQKFVLVGSGLSHLNKYPNVKIYENISEKKKADIVSKASALLMTSTSRNEAFGIVLVESLRSGIPILSPDLNSGVSFVNQDNLTGFFYKTGDINDLRIKLKKFIRLELSKYLELRFQARLRYKQIFNLDNMIDSLDEIYYEIS
ncbi:glycosyltransferase [Alphaproteobacteria bacterium]|jgi:glycosyltransferase involved in cell wall biosynthesis|nr:glycosyltransferase [Alphaproteobacteria bacterium]